MTTLYQKYSPTNIDEFVGNAFVRSFMKVFITNNWDSLGSLVTNNELGFIISGSPKTGKKTLEKIFLETSKCSDTGNKLVFNPDDIPADKMSDVVLEMKYPSVDDGSKFLGKVCLKEGILCDILTLKRIFRLSSRMVGESLKRLESLSIACDGRIDKKVGSPANYLFIFDDVIKWVQEGKYEECYISSTSVAEDFLDFNDFVSMFSGVVADLILKDMQSGGTQRQLLSNLTSCIYHFRSLSNVGDFSDSANLLFNYIFRKVFSGGKVSTGSRIISGDAVLDFLSQ